jgi:hypothetical protein
LALAVMTMIYIGYVLWPRWPAAEVDPARQRYPW